MQKVYLIIKKQAGELSYYSVVPMPGATVRVSAGQASRFVLSELPDGKSPQKIKVVRRGSDLLLSMQDEPGAEVAEVVLEGFYESGAQDLMGLRSDGTLYQYMVPTEQGPLSLSQLAPDVIGEGVLSFGATGAAVINPLTFSALPVAGGTAALAVGASNGGKALSAQELALQALGVIQRAADTNTADHGVLGVATFEALGVRGVTPSNMVLIGHVLNHSDVDGQAMATPEAVQAMVNAVHKLQVLGEFGTAGRPEAELHAGDMGALGLAGVLDTASKRAFFQSVLGGSGAVEDFYDVARISSAVVSAADGAVPVPALTVADFSRLGVSGVTEDSVAATLTALAGQPGVQTVADLQAVVDQTNRSAVLAPVITVDVIAGDAVGAGGMGEYNALERGTGPVPQNHVVVNGSTTAEVGTEVQLMVNGHTHRGSVLAGAPGQPNVWSVDLGSAQSAALVHGNVYVITVQSTNAAGNTSTDATHRLKINTQTPDVPVVHTQLTNQTQPTVSGVARKIIDAGGDMSDPANFRYLEAGDTVSITLNGATVHGVVGTNTGGFSYDLNTGVWTLQTSGVSGFVPLSTGSYNVEVRVTAGGVSTVDASVSELQLDNIRPGDIQPGVPGAQPVPVLSLAQAVDAMSAAELAAGIPLVVALPTGSAVGDVVTLTVTSPTGQTGTVAHTLVAADLSGTLTLLLPASMVSQEGAYGVATTVSDAAGNSSAQGTFDMVVTLALTRLGVFAEAANAGLPQATAAVGSGGLGLTAPDVDMYNKAGIADVDANNLAVINAALASAGVNGAATDSVSKVQGIVDAYNKLLAAADGTAGNTSGSDVLSRTDFEAIGVTGLSNTSAALLSTLIDGQVAADINTPDKVQVWADTAAAVAAGTASQAQLESLGVSGITQGNLAGIQAALAAAVGAGPVTLADLHSIADGVNDAPVWSGQALALPSVLQDVAAPVGAVGALVSSLSGGITDADSGATAGIAITGVSSHGTLYFSTDGGTTWTAVVAAADGNALLLSADDNNRLYFQPNAAYFGTISDALTLRAWDTTSGVEGEYASTSDHGGISAFSSQTGTIGLQVVRAVTINTVSADDQVVMNESIPLSGAAQANAVVVLNINGAERSVTADGSGNWTYDTKLVPEVRYVMVRKLLNGTFPDFYASQGVFNISDINVLSNGTNVAAGRVVSVGSNTRQTGTSTSLTDGAQNTSHESTTVGEAWVQVDLGDYYRVDAIELIARPSWAGRLDNSTIYASVNDMSGLTSAQLTAAALGNNASVLSYGVLGSSDASPFRVNLPNASDKDVFTHGSNTITASALVDGVSSSSQKVVTWVATTAPVLADMDLSLAALAKNAGVPTGALGTLVKTLAGGVSDADAHADQGIAITGVNANGVLYYSTNGGLTWVTATGVSNTNALLLRADVDNRIYFKPNTGFSGDVDAITFRAWDATSGADASYGDASVNGGNTAFSTATDTVSVSVIADVLVNAISTDNVIRSGENIAISGVAPVSSVVTVSFANGKTVSTTSDSSGIWSVGVTPVPASVRYVMLRKTSVGEVGSGDFVYGANGVWALRDVKVMSGGVDVAAGKLAKLSWSSDTTGALTDGTDGTYAEVGRVGTNWIQIDLGASYSIDNIQIQPRSGWNVRLTGTHVYMSDTDLSGLSSDQLANASDVFRGESFAPNAATHTFQFVPLLIGDNEITVSALDNGTTVQETAPLFVDTIPPSPAQLALREDTGENTADRITADNQIELTFPSADVARWTYSTDAGLTWTEGTGSAFGLPIGQYAVDRVQVRAYDAAGNFSLTKNTQTYQIIEKAVVSWIQTDDQAVLVSSFATTDTTPTVRGLLEVGLTAAERIAVYIDGVFQGSAAVDGLNWSYTPAVALGVADHRLSWQLENNSSGSWVASTAPRTHDIQVTDAVATQRYNLEQWEDGILFSGVSAPGAKLRIDWGGQSSGVVNADVNGRWSYTYYKQNSFFGVAAPSTGAEHTLTLSELNAAGTQVVQTLFSHQTLIDVTPPQLTSWSSSLGDDVAAVQPGDSVTLTLTFNEDLGNALTINDFTVFGGQLSQLSGAGHVRTLVFTADAHASSPTWGSIALLPGSLKDAAGNAADQLWQTGVSIPVAGAHAIKPLTQAFQLRAGSDVALDARDPLINMSTSDWRVAISGVPTGVSLSHGSLANGVWTVAGTDLHHLTLLTTNSVAGTVSLNLTYFQKDAQGNWQSQSKAQLSGYVHPWFARAVGQSTEDFSNFTDVQEAWNYGLTGLSGKGVVIGINEGTSVNRNIAEAHFALGNVLLGSASQTTTEHGHTVGQRAVGAVDSPFVGVAYDANVKWINGDQTGIDVSNWSVSSSQPDGQWDLAENVTGRGGLGTIRVISGGNAGNINTSVQRSTKGPGSIVVASIDNNNGGHSGFNKGQAIWVAHPGGGGTSYASPAVAGQVAMMLEVDPGLGIRDVKNILAMGATYYTTATPLNSFSMNVGNTLNGAGVKFSNELGFGVSNAYNAVRLSKDWLRQGTASTMQTDWLRSSPVAAAVAVAISATANQRTSIQLNVTDDIRMEALQLISNISVNSDFAKLRVWVTSPSGTESVLMSSEPAVGTQYNGELRLTTNKFFGESSKGIWTVHYEYAQDAGANGSVRNVKLELLGSLDAVVDRYVYTDEFDLHHTLADASTKEQMFWLADRNGGVDAVMGSAMNSDIQIDLGLGGHVKLLNRHVGILAGTQIENAFGGDGNDTLLGNQVVGSILSGNAGNDVLISKGRQSRLEGGDGQDSIWFQFGDTVFGGEGSDRFFVLQNQLAFTDANDVRLVIQDFDASQDSLFSVNAQGVLQLATFGVNGGFRSWALVEDSSVKSAFEDMQSLAGNPQLGGVSVSGNELTLRFDEQMDVRGALQSGDFLLNGQAVTASAWFSADSLRLTAANAWNAGVINHLELVGSPVRSGLGLGWDVSEVWLGTAGADNINRSSASANQVLMGNGGQDTLVGGAGDDVLWAMFNTASSLTGGAGSDQFALQYAGSNAMSAGVLRITDFRAQDQDRLVLTDVLAQFEGAGSLGQWLELTKVGNDAQLKFDATGSATFAGAAYVLQLDGFYSVNASFENASLTEWVKAGILMV